MPTNTTPKKASAAKAAPRAKAAGTNGRAARGVAALDGLEVSLEDAQKAMLELRTDLSTGGRRMVKDVEVAIKNARRDLKRTRKAIQSDLEDLSGALTPRKSAKSPAKSTRARAR